MVTTARKVDRKVERNEWPPDMRSIWMVKLSMMERVTHFAEAEQDWLFLTVRRAAANGAVDLHGHPLLSSRDHAEAEALADGRVRAVKVAS